jgi:hypothetical protein
MSEIVCFSVLNSRLYVARMNLYNLIFEMVILIPFLTQPPHERNLTGWGSQVYPKGRGSRVYPNVGAAGCTLTSGQPGVAWSGQEVCSGFALAARAARSRLVVRIGTIQFVYKMYELNEFVPYNLYMYEFVLLSMF